MIASGIKKNMAIKISNNKIYCFDPKYRKWMKMGQKLGETFFKIVEEKNFMRMVNGYGFQYDAFAQFEANGITEIRVYERHTGNTWKSKPKDWVDNGRIMDYGRGKQIFLSLKYMSLIDKKALEKEKEKVEKIRQQTLLEVRQKDNI